MSVSNPSRDCFAVAKRLLDIDEACRMAASMVRSAVGVETVVLSQAVGRVLAEHIIAPIPLPLFDHSAMDGYAVRIVDFQGIGSTALPVVGRQTAGSRPDELAHGAVRRIFTGAPLPVGADAVVMQERCHRDSEVVHFSELPARGDNIRRQGEDLARGAVVLKAGQRLDTRHIGVLAALGIPEVTVRRRMRIIVISSGNELIEPGDYASVGQVFDCNRPMLLALLTTPSVSAIDGGCYPDDPAVLADVLKSASRNADVVLITGGTADGEEDHTRKAIFRAGGKARRLRVALKPGKPSLIGRLGDAVVIGLPGNPVAALVNFLLLGRSAIDSLVGRNCNRRTGLPAISAASYRHAQGRTEFVPAIISSNSERLEIEILGRGGSAKFAPLISADGLVEISSSIADLAAGAPVGFHPFTAMACL